MSFLQTTPNVPVGFWSVSVADFCHLFWAFNWFISKLVKHAFTDAPFVTLLTTTSNKEMTRTPAPGRFVPTKEQSFECCLSTTTNKQNIKQTLVFVCLC